MPANHKMAQSIKDPNAFRQKPGLATGHSQKHSGQSHLCWDSALQLSAVSDS
jgi:hypothetical protein